MSIISADSLPAWLQGFLTLAGGTVIGSFIQHFFQRNKLRAETRHLDLDSDTRIAELVNKKVELLLQHYESELLSTREEIKENKVEISALRKEVISLRKALDKQKQECKDCQIGRDHQA